MRVGAAGDHRHNLRYTEFGAFFNGPLHAIKFENGEQEGDISGGIGTKLLSQFKLHPSITDAGDFSVAHSGAGGNVEFLADAGTQGANQMVSVFTLQRGVSFRNFVGDPSAAGHACG